MVRHVDGPDGEELALLGCPIRFSSSGWVPSAPPRLGQHTEEVLGALCGYDEAQLAELRRARVI
jgi:crotonobetainyl-CoA:carnitine CoA-transferase CaiB-like acyl-CoA transferase